MYKKRRYVIAIGMMLFTSIITLLVVSTLTYWFKWQADKAMVGIIVTYVLAGVAGGIVLGPESLKKRILQAGLLAFLYLLVLTVLVFVFFDKGLEFSKQAILTYGLVMGSVFMGRNLVK